MVRMLKKIHVTWWKVGQKAPNQINQQDIKQQFAFATKKVNLTKKNVFFCRYQNVIAIEKLLELPLLSFSESIVLESTSR